jgi:HEAT repeat protein
MAVDPLIAALGDKDEKLRESAIFILGMIRDTRAVEPLITLLRDKFLAGDAAKTLNLLGWKPSKDANGAAYYIALEKWDQCVKIGAPAVKPLISILKDNLYEETSEAAARSLIRIGSPAVDELITVLGGKDDNARKYAIQVLGQVGDPRAVAPIIASLRDKSVAGVAAQALNNLQWTPGNDADGAAYYAALQEWDRCFKLGTPAVEPLLSILSEWEFYGLKAVCAAIDALGRIGSPHVVEPLIACLKHKRKQIRQAAVEALGKIADPRSVAPLLDLVDDKDEFTRRITIQALGQIGDARAVHGLLPLLKNHDWDTRRVAAEALVMLYQSNRLDEKSRHSILVQQSMIAQAHEDLPSHLDAQKRIITKAMRLIVSMRIHQHTRIQVLASLSRYSHTSFGKYYFSEPCRRRKKWDFSDHPMSKN